MERASSQGFSSAPLRPTTMSPMLRVASHMASRRPSSINYLTMLTQSSRERLSPLLARASKIKLSADRENEHQAEYLRHNKGLFRYFAALLITATSLVSASPQDAYGSTSRTVGDFGTSGLVFKDSLKVDALDDPKVEGVTLYISDFQIPITEKFQNGFNDPGAVGITCAKTGPIRLKKGVSKSKAGEEVFSESRSLFFGKSIKVRRIFDEEKKTLLYISYSDRLDKTNDENKSRFKSAICALPLDASVGDGMVEKTSVSSSPTTESMTSVSIPSTIDTS